MSWHGAGLEDEVCFGLLFHLNLLPIRISLADFDAACYCRCCFFL